MKIKILGLDPSLSNLGCAECTYDLTVGKLEIVDLKLYTTTNQAGKKVKQSEDDLRRGREMYANVQWIIQGYDVVIAERPGGAQDSRAALASGIVLGVLASIPNLIEVTPIEVKKAALGKNSGDKIEMIEWAVSSFPQAPWPRRKFKGEMRVMNQAEHLADSLGVIHAGILTNQFKQVLNNIQEQK